MKASAFDDVDGDAGAETRRDFSTNESEIIVVARPRECVVAIGATQREQT